MIKQVLSAELPVIEASLAVMNINLPSSSLPGCDHRVTELEAQRIEETKEDRDAFRRMLREEIERQAREKNIEIKLPPDKPEQ